MYIESVDDCWLVCDELGNVLESCDSHAVAKSSLRKHLKPVSNVTRYPGTYGMNTSVLSKTHISVKPPDDIEVPYCDSFGNALPNSKRVRIRIRIAKEHNEPPENVVAWAIEHCGMKKPLAKAYVNNNWHRRT